MAHNFALAKCKMLGVESSAMSSKLMPANIYGRRCVADEYVTIKNKQQWKRQFWGTS